MSINEIRKDYLLDRWVVISPQRRKRPANLAGIHREERKRETCPFCPGNEHLTPPATLVYYLENGSIKVGEDEDGFRHKNWVLRCVPNLYPAFSPLGEETSPFLSEERRYIRFGALGFHEVLIESPNHDEHPGVARVEQLAYAIKALRDRTFFFMRKSYVKYISIFRNHGASAGASLSHPHMQIIAMPIVPRIVSEESAASKKYYEASGRCIFCEIISEESGSERFIGENSDFVVFAPWASINPFEFWILPKMHQQSILSLSEDEIKGFAEILRLSLGGLRRLLNDPPYNFGFHMLPLEEHYHWHVEVYPNLAVWAGFEKSTGMYINIVAPEEAAKSLKEAFMVESSLLRGSI